MDFATLDYYQILLPALVVLIFALRNKDQSSRIMLLLASSYVFFWFSSGLYVLLLLKYLGRFHSWEKAVLLDI